MPRLALLFCLVWLAEASHWIHSPRTTNWGAYGASEFCPPGHYAQGFQFKFERAQRSKDDTAGNGVRLLCRAPGSTTTSKEISSAVGNLGFWTPSRFCEGFIVGYRLAVEANQRGDDDTATNKIQVQCSDGKTIVSDGTNYGTWRGWVRCPKGSVVDGIRTQVESDQGPGIGGGNDDTALNNVDMRCAPFRPTCTPADAWNEVWRCENLNVEGATCTYEQAVGTSWGSEESKSTETGESYSTTLGVELSASFKGIVETSFRAEHSWSKSTSHAWSQSTTREFSDEKKTTVTSPAIPVGKVMIVEQVKGTCGPLTVATQSFRLSYRNISPRAVDSFACSQWGWRFMDGYDLEGNDLRWVERGHRNDCQGLCRAEEGCRGYTWSGGICYLKSGGATATSHGGAYSALIC